MKVKNIENYFGIFDSFNHQFFDPSYSLIQVEEILSYLAEYPFPADPDYSQEDLIRDLTRSSGSLIIPCKNRETAEFICELLNSLLP